MKVELSIKDDRELKNHIKDVIRGEVKSISRGEIRSIILDVFKDKYNGNAFSNADKIINEEVRALVRSELDASRGSFGSSTPSYIKKVAREYVEEYLSKSLKQDGILK